MLLLVDPRVMAAHSSIRWRVEALQVEALPLSVLDDVLVETAR